jgi:hypothetical protein
MRKRLDGGFYTDTLVLQSNPHMAGLGPMSIFFSKFSLDVDWIANSINL